MGKIKIIAATLLITAAVLFAAINFQLIPMGAFQRPATQTLSITTTPTTTKVETERETQTTLTTTATYTMSLDLDAIHESLDASHIPELKNIIRSHPDEQVRERAIYILTDIAMRWNLVDDAVNFLKEIANDERNDRVRTAAYASLDLIRTYFPLETRGELRISVEGDIRRGDNITLIFEVSSQVDVLEARARVERIMNLRNESVPPHVGVMLMSRNPVRFTLREGETKTIPFTLHIQEYGEYLILCQLRLSFDRIDYQDIRKLVYLGVYRDRGLYIVADSLREIAERLNITATTPMDTQPPTTPQQPAIVDARLIGPSKIYFSSALERPGKIYVYDYQSSSLSVLIQEQADYLINSFAFHPDTPERLYYVDGDEKKILFVSIESGESGTVFTHDEYVRFVRFGHEGRIYFSESYGSGGDGEIFWIGHNFAELYYVVRLELVGYWAGSFDFDKDGILYLSSGNVTPSTLFMVVNGVPQRIAVFDFPVMGLRCVSGVKLQTEQGEVQVEKGLLFTDFKHTIYLYDLYGDTLYKIYENTGINLISDASL